MDVAVEAGHEVAVADDGKDTNLIKNDSQSAETNPDSEKSSTILKLIKMGLVQHQNHSL